MDCGEQSVHQDGLQLTHWSPASKWVMILAYVSIQSLILLIIVFFHNYTDDSNLVPVSTLINSTASKPVFYSNVNCHGFEDTLSHCTKISYPHFQCNYNYYNGIYVHSNVRMRCHDGKFYDTF